MTTSMYCLYVGVDYTYIDVNALAQGSMYVCMYVCMYACMYICMYVERGRNVLFNDALNTFYLRLYGVRHG